MIENIVQDIRYAARQLMRAPLFTAISAVSLALAITVAVAAYSIINSLIFKEPPVTNPDGIVHVFSSPSDQKYGGSSYDDLVEYRGTGAFEDLAARVQVQVIMSANNRAAARVDASYVTPNYFRLIGLKLSAGHSFSPDGRSPQVVVSERFVKRTFNKGDRVLGSAVRINGVDFTIVGITPTAFRGINDYTPSAVWMPAPALALMGKSSDWLKGGSRYWDVIGRLSPGVTAVVATQRVAAIVPALALRSPGWRDGHTVRHVRVIGNHDLMVELAKENLAEPLLALSALVSVVLILACTNVAGLLLARTVSRRHEVAVRLTLGAQKSRIASQFMIEAIMLSLISGAVGLCGAEWIIALTRRSPMFDSFDLSPDWRIFASTFMTCVLCALAFGLTPLGQTLRINIGSGLSGTAVGERGGVRGRLISLQVCLSCLLVVLGLHASRGVQAKTRTSASFHADGLLVAELRGTGGQSAADSAARREYVRTAESILRASPSVLRTTISSWIPMIGSSGGWTTIALANATTFGAFFQRVDFDYFPTLGITARSGKIPMLKDAAPSQRIVIVNKRLSDIAGRSVVGTSIRIDENNFYVAGEIDDLQRVASGERYARVYELKQMKDAVMYRNFLIARVQPGAEPQVTALLIRGMRNRYPDRVPPEVEALRSRINTDIAPLRYVANTASAFGIVELTLAAIGLYSLLLYSMLTRTREIGVRMALGAEPLRASFAIMKNGLTYVLGGLLLGALASIPAGIIAGRTFTGADPRDPLPYIAAFGGIAIATIAAAWGPARRAARVQPIVALRHE